MLSSVPQKLTPEKHKRISVADIFKTLSLLKVINMSVISCIVLLLSLLCMDAFHTCNARSLVGAISKENKENNMLPLPTRDDNKVGDVKQSIETKSNMKEPIQDSMVKQTRVENSDQISRKSKTKNGKGIEAKHSNSKQGDDGSLVSISWRVPHNKRDEKQPGFNLDYSPPREHPGHHN